MYIGVKLMDVSPLTLSINQHEIILQCKCSSTLNHLGIYNVDDKGSIEHNNCPKFADK